MSATDSRAHGNARIHPSGGQRIRAQRQRIRAHGQRIRAHRQRIRMQGQRIHVQGQRIHALTAMRGFTRAGQESVTDLIRTDDARAAYRELG